jgi:hypothetical protein
MKVNNGAELATGITFGVLVGSGATALYFWAWFLRWRKRRTFEIRGFTNGQEAQQDRRRRAASL